MWTRWFVLSLASTALLAAGTFASPAAAMSKSSDPGGEPSPTPAEQDIQEILDGLVVSGPPIDASSPSPFELFSAGSTGITAQIVTANDDLFFGIYDGDNPVTNAVLLWGTDPTTFVRSVSFSDKGMITFGSGPYDWRSGFDGPFGFFVKVPSDGQFVFIYTEDALNGGAQRALAFQGNGQTVIQLPGLQPGVFRPDQFILAFDADGDGNYGDMVVAIAGIAVPVPEPGTAVLVGLSLLILGRLRRS